jgi:hypothetical protein
VQIRVERKEAEHQHLEGYEQIAGQGLKGIVAVGLDNVAAVGMNRFIQFPDDPNRIRAGMANELGKWITTTIKSRAGTPGRAPIASVA